MSRFQDYATARSNPEQQSFTGFYWTSADMSPAQSKLLAEKYPGLDFRTIPYLEVRDHKGTQGFRRALYFAIAAVPLLVVGIAGLVILNRRRLPPVGSPA